MKNWRKRHELKQFESRGGWVGSRVVRRLVLRDASRARERREDSDGEADQELFVVLRWSPCSLSRTLRDRRALSPIDDCVRFSWYPNDCEIDYRGVQVCITLEAISTFFRTINTRWKMKFRFFFIIFDKKKSIAFPKCSIAIRSSVSSNNLVHRTWW